MTVSSEGRAALDRLLAQLADPGQAGAAGAAAAVAAGLAAALAQLTLALAAQRAPDQQDALEAARARAGEIRTAAEAAIVRDAEAYGRVRGTAGPARAEALEAAARVPAEVAAMAREAARLAAIARDAAGNAAWRPDTEAAIVLGETAADLADGLAAANRRAAAALPAD